MNNGTKLNWDEEKKETVFDISGTMRVLIDKNEDALPVIDVEDIFNTFHSDDPPTVTNMYSYFARVKYWIFKKYIPVVKYFHWVFLDPQS